jgi:hypothetical protein
MKMSWLDGILIGIVVGLSLVLTYKLYKYNTIMGQIAGNYNPDTKEIWCTSEDICNHEEGHKLDASLGWISTSKAFIDAVDYRLETISYPGINAPYLILNCNFLGIDCSQKWGGYTELYADLWKEAKGDINNIDPQLQQFFK